MEARKGRRVEITDDDMQMLAKDWRAFVPAIPDGAEQITDDGGAVWVRELPSSPRSAGRVWRLRPKKGAATLTAHMVRCALKAGRSNGYTSERTMADRGLLAVEVVDVTDLTKDGVPVVYSLTERGVYALGALAFVTASEALQ